MKSLHIDWGMKLSFWLKEEQTKKSQEEKQQKTTTKRTMNTNSNNKNNNNNSLKAIKLATIIVSEYLMTQFILNLTKTYGPINEVIIFAVILYGLLERVEIKDTRIKLLILTIEIIITHAILVAGLNMKCLDIFHVYSIGLNWIAFFQHLYLCLTLASILYVSENHKELNK